MIAYLRTKKLFKYAWLECKIPVIVNGCASIDVRINTVIKDEMSKTIFIFIKSFNRKEYAEDFLDGKLFFNRLSYFKGLEDEGSATRGDKYETVVDWRQPEKVKLTISFNGNSFDIKDLAAPFYVQATGLNDMHVFCLYAAHSGNLVDIEVDGSEIIKGKLHIPTELSRFGEHAVIITQPVSFIERVSAAIKMKRHRGSAGLVEYYDPETFSGEFSNRDALFRKRKEFSYQSEYRFAFNTDTTGSESVTLDVGSLRDIAQTLLIEDIYGGTKLELNRIVKSC